MNEEKLDKIHDCLKEVFYTLNGTNGAIGLVQRMEEVEKILKSYRFDFLFIKVGKWVAATIGVAWVIWRITGGG